MKFKWWIAGYMIAMALVLIAPLASPDPDGLERVAEDKGFIDEGSDAPYSIIADYVFPGIENETLATILAGWIGVTAMMVIVAGIAYIIHRRNSSRISTGQASG